MSVESLAAVLNHSHARGTAKLVLVGIANHDGDGGAWPTVATLARYANVDPRSVQRSLTVLQAAGEIAVDIQAGGTPDCEDFHRPNRYRILVGCPPWCDRTNQHRDTRTNHLWINRVTETSPGDASVTPPLTPVSPDPLTPASPKPSIEPCADPVSALTTDRARVSVADVRAQIRRKGTA